MRDYEDILKSQNNVCAICKSDKNLNVDHCHETGKVRGILCGICNRAIGLLGDTYDSIARVLQYLEKEYG